MHKWTKEQAYTVLKVFYMIDIKMRNEEYVKFVITSTKQENQSDGNRHETLIWAKFPNHKFSC